MKVSFFSLVYSLNKLLFNVFMKLLFVSLRYQCGVNRFCSDTSSDKSFARLLIMTSQID